MITKVSSGTLGGGGGNSLWTPDGDRPLDHQRGVEPMAPPHMAVIRELHTIAQKHGIQIVCAKCGVPFQGMNDGAARTESIFCKCREIRSDSGRQIVTGARLR